MWVDVSLAEVGIFGHVVFQHVEVDDDESDVAAYLWRCQSHAVSLCEGLKHVGDELFEFGIVSRDVLCFLAQYGLSVSINR